MPWLWTAVCGESNPATDWCSDPELDWPTVARTASVGCDRASDGRVWAVVTNVRQPKILSDPTTGSSHKKKPGTLTIQLDEMWSFVGSKGCKKVIQNWSAVFWDYSLRGEGSLWTADQFWTSFLSGQQAVDLVGNRCWQSWDCGSLCWRPQSSKCQEALAILTSSLSSMCSLLHWFLGGIWASATQ